jgi:hypothetical protein
VWGRISGLFNWNWSNRPRLRDDSVEENESDIRQVQDTPSQQSRGSNGYFWHQSAATTSATATTAAPPSGTESNLSSEDRRESSLVFPTDDENRRPTDGGGSFSFAQAITAQRSMAKTSSMLTALPPEFASEIQSPPSKAKPRSKPPTPTSGKKLEIPSPETHTKPKRWFKPW